MQEPISIGTRGSPLALAQAHEVRARLCAAHNLTEDNFNIVVLSTKGDRITDRPLADIGGKGLFTEEIEAALYEGSIDLAVHSLKDMATIIPDGLELVAFLEREDVRDAFLSSKATSLLDLPEGAVVGTSSLRRQAQTLSIRPDIKVVPFRGNVQTRLKKLDAGEVDATFLALAGLNRLGLQDDRIHALETSEMLPAVAQGTIAIEIATGNDKVRDLLRPLNHKESEIRVRAERAMLKILDGSCRTPIAGLATLAGEQLTLRGRILEDDGSRDRAHEITGSCDNPEEVGSELGQTLLDM